MCSKWNPIKIDGRWFMEQSSDTEGWSRPMYWWEKIKYLWLNIKICRAEKAEAKNKELKKRIKELFDIIEEKHIEVEKLKGVIVPDNYNFLVIGKADYAKLQDGVKQLTSLKKMCQAIVKYNENRSRDSEQYLVRRDMFERIVNALEALKD